jgi:putative endonuclease
MFYLYIIQSLKTGKFYIGHTNDLVRRFNEHNSGQTKSTRSGKPWVLVYSCPFETNLEAGKEELRLKKMKSHKYIEELVARPGFLIKNGELRIHSFNCFLAIDFLNQF